MSTKNTYRLLNPYIEGSINTVINADNSFSAGKKIYKTISNFFTNHVDDFYMTLQNLETKNLTHFKIGEKKGENGFVDYYIIKLDGNFSKELEKKLINNVEKLMQQNGGSHEKKNDDDDDNDSPSESSSSSEKKYYQYVMQPISKFIYFTLPYYKLQLIGLTPYDISRIYLPMFSLPINPSLEIRFDLYRYN